MGTVNKSEVARIVAEAAGLQIRQAEAAIEATLTEITRRAGHGDTVRFNGFGSFSVKARPARTGRNPATGAPVDIPESRKLVFKAGKAKADA